MEFAFLVNVEKLPPGTHGIHIHTIGKCEGPAFTTAGGHSNPDMKKHGKDNPDGPHAGDLLNLEVRADGADKVTCMRWASRSAAARILSSTTAALLW
jgi:Cu-Zn family superoxide dismutase